MHYSALKLVVADIRSARINLAAAKELLGKCKYSGAKEKIDESVSFYKKALGAGSDSRLSIECAGALLVKGKIEVALTGKIPLSVFYEALLNNPKIA